MKCLWPARHWSGAGAALVNGAAPGPCRVEFTFQWGICKAMGSGLCSGVHPGRGPGAAESPGEMLRERWDLNCVLKAEWSVHSERAGGLSDGV